MHDLAIFSMRTEAGRIVVPTNRPEAEHFLVELDRTFEIRDLESHSSEMRRFGKPIFGGTDSTLSICGCCRRHVILRCCLMCGKCYASAPSSSLWWRGQKVLIVANTSRTISTACAVRVSTLG